MRAWRVHELGDPSTVLRLEDVDQPVPAEGQLLVRVRAAALNFPDVLMAAGTYQERPPLPYTPGVELCGETEDGRRVIGSPAGGPGAFAEYALMNADIRAWIDTWNDNPRPYVWTKTADQILETIAKYCTRINDSGH